MKNGILDGIPESKEKPMAVLKDTQARNILPESKAVAHGAVKGLSLHPSKKKGNGKWVLRYTSPVTKKRRNAGLGSYP